MSRTTYPFYSNDISTLARSLKQQWAEQDSPPSHLQIMNMLARATGFQNYQHWRAAANLETTQDTPAITDSTSNKPDATTQRLLRHFDDSGRMIRWPKKFSEQSQCLWVIWATLPAQGQHSEQTINDCLRQTHTFGDHVLLRRELVNHGLMGRTDDCRVYWRNAREPDAANSALITAITQRKMAS